MKIGYIQTAPIFGEKEKNFGQVSTLIKGITADLLVLPELFATGYTITSMEEVKQLAEKAGNGITFNFLAELSIQTGAIIVGGFIEESEGSYYNASMLIDQGQLIGIYRKIHLFNKEKLWFTKGDLPLQTYTLRGVNIGMMICFDWMFPEVSRTLAMQGAHIIAHPSNLVLPYCQDAMVTRCLENGVFAITANRIGREKRGEDDFTFTGQSQITSNKGSKLLVGPIDQPSIGVVEIDPSLALDKRINAYNDLFLDI